MAEKGIEKELLIKMYRLMLTSRIFDNKFMEMHAKGQMIGMSPHSGHGQEAIGVGGCVALRKDDYLVPSHRGEGHVIAKGTSLKTLLADLCGKATGASKGKGHWGADLENNILGMTGMVGAGPLIATGVGWSIRIRKTDQVVMVFFGDGAASQSDFYQSLNLSAAWKLPVVFMCENNMIQEFTEFQDISALKDIADMAKPFGMPAAVLDGNDVIAVYKAAREAVERARKGKGPTLIECKTYRWRPHYEGAPDHRSKEEIGEWMKKCPIKRFEAKLLKMKVLNEEEAKKIEKEVTAEIEEAARFAIESPWPEPDELYTDVYA